MPLLLSGVKTPLFPWVLVERIQRKKVADVLTLD
jgi:hypothetical protein